MTPVKFTGLGFAAATAEEYGAAKSNPRQMNNTDLRDLDVSGLAAAFPTRLSVGRATLMARLSAPQDDPAVLVSRREEIRGIRARLKADKDVRATVETLRQEMAAAEEACESVADAASDTRHAEYYNQILWPADSFLAWLNERGWWNELMLFFRSVFLPGTSVVMPVLLFAAPLILMWLAPPASAGGSKEPMSMKRYMEILQRALRQAMPSSLGKPRFAGRGGFAEMAEQFVHVGIAVAMFVASSWNQVSAAMGLRRVADDMRGRAAAVQRMADSVKKLADLLGLGLDESVGGAMRWITDGDGDMAVFGKAWNRPEHVRLLLAEAGRLDMLTAVALCRRTCFPEQDDTTLELVDLYHPGLEPGARVYNTVRMGSHYANASSTHVLLTGPNRGGKSTLLKALGSAVLMSQTVGVVFARKARLPVFGSIVTALSPADRLGELSLFEAEIEFAKGVRATIAGATKPVFLMMDEIFHGTNAHDGVEASQVFLDDLYTSPKEKLPVFSVVSTHYMELPKRYGDGRAQLLCMEASVDPADSDRLIYTYRLCPGVNRFSSVREILRERGLLVCGDQCGDRSVCGTPAQKTSVSAAE